MKALMTTAALAASLAFAAPAHAGFWSSIGNFFGGISTPVTTGDGLDRFGPLPRPAYSYYTREGRLRWANTYNEQQAGMAEEARKSGIARLMDRNQWGRTKARREYMERLGLKVDDASGRISDWRSDTYEGGGSSDGGGSNAAPW